MRKMPTVVVGLAGILAAASAQAYCFHVYRGPLEIYRSTRSPVDMSRPLGETVTARFGSGAYMVFVPDSTDCPAFELYPNQPSPVLDDSSLRSPPQRKR